MIGRTPVRAANARASAESAAVPEDQPWIRRLPEISLVSPWESLAVGVHSELDRNVAELALRARPGSLPAPRWCSAPERHQDAVVAEVCSLASWGAASLWTGALFWQKIP